MKYSKTIFQGGKEGEKDFFFTKLLLYLFLLSTLSIPQSSSFDDELFYACGGDNELIIVCQGDLGIKKEIVSGGVPKEERVIEEKEKISFLSLILLIVLFSSMMCVLLFFFYKRRKKKQKV